MRRRPIRRALLVASVLVAALLAVVGGVWVLLGTAADRAVVVRQVLAAVNRRIAGRLELQKAWLFPNGHLIARDVAIYDPEGGVTIRAATVDTRVDLRALAGGRLHLTGTQITGASVFLATDARGALNIVKAFELRAPSPPPTPGAPVPKPRFALQIDGAEVALAEAQFGTAELTGPLHLTATVGIQGSDLRVSTTAAQDDASLTAQLDLNVTTLRGQGELTGCSLGPHFLAAWVPGLEPRGVRGNASVQLEPGAVHLLSLDATPIDGRGELHVTGVLDLKSGNAQAHLAAADLDAHALSTRLPVTSAGFEIDALADEVLRPQRRVSAKVELGPSTVAGQKIGPGALEARLEGETLTASRLELGLPGAQVRGSGSLAAQRVAADVQVEAFDLAHLRPAIESLSGTHLPHVTGRLSSQVRLTGSLAAPALQAELRAPHLFLNGVEADDVEAHVAAPRLGRQLDIAGTAALGNLRAADRSLRDVVISLSWKTPGLHVEARAQERGKELELLCDAVLPPDLSGGTLSSLELRVPGDRWRLLHPTTVDFRHGIALDHLELAAEPQRLSATLDVRAHALHVTVEAEALDLSTLAAPLPLSGRVAGVARYQEEGGSRAGSLDLTATGLAYQGSEPSTASAKLALRGEQITGDAFVQLAHGRATLSIAAPLRKTAGPLEARLEATGLQLDDLARFEPRLTRYHGEVSLELGVSGTFSEPRGDLALAAHHLDYDHRALGELQLHLKADGTGVDANAQMNPPGGQLRASARWDLPPRLLNNPGARQEAKLTAELRGSDLPLAAALGESSAVQGLADLTASLRGSLGHPRGRAQLSFRELKVRQAPSGDLAAEATWDGAHVQGTLTGHQPRGGQLTGHATLALDRASGDPPLTADLDAVGFDLGALNGLATQNNSLRAVAGHLDAHLRIEGTLRSPQPRGVIALSQGELAVAGLGQFNAITAQVDVRPDGAELRRLSALSSSGTLVMTGTVSRAGSGSMAIRAHLDTDRFGVFASDRLVGLLSSSGDLTGLVDRARTQLTLNVQRAELRLPQLIPKSPGPTSIDSDIVLGPESPPPTRRAAAYPLDIHVIAPDSLRLEGADVSLRARADVRLSIQGDVEMAGGVFATGGEVNAYGRRFEVERANVTFGHGQQLGPAGEPDVDARAAQTIGAYRLFIDVTGHPRSLSIVSSTEPPLDKGSVGQLLVTGSADSLEGRPGAAGPSGGLAAASAFGGLLTEKLKESLGPYMPLDVLTVEPSRLEAGKRLTPELYFGAIQNLGAIDPRINGAEIHANYKLSLHWSLDSRYGTARAGNLDLQWTRAW